MNSGTSLVVQWLRCHASTAGGVGSIPGQRRSHRLWGAEEISLREVFHLENLELYTPKQ